MNSKSIKQAHTTVYEQFFQEHQIVVSAPFLMTWAGDLSPYYSGLTIKQKLPLRLYMGVKINSSAKIHFDTIHYFDKSVSAFLTESLLHHVPHFHAVQEHVSTEWKHLLESYGGIEINILSELPRGMGLGFESLLSFLLATVLYRLAGHIEHKNVEHINAMPIEEALKTSDVQISDWLTA
jgi:galactokinase